MGKLTRAEIRNLIRILYGENPNKLYSISERDALANKLTALREKAPRISPN